MDEATDPILIEAASLPTHQDLHGCTTERSTGSESRSSEWLDELEAALGHLQNAALGAAKAGMGADWRSVVDAHKSLTLVLEDERSRSSNGGDSSMSTDLKTFIPRKSRRGAHSLDRLVRALRDVAAHWPNDYWLFADGSTLALLKTVNGERKYTKRGCVDPTCIVETFRIPNDGGDY